MDAEGTNLFGGSEAGKLGGEARAKSLSAEERREIARKGAAKRWGKPSVPVATHGSEDHPLKIGDVEIPCYVLENEKRVLTQKGILRALGSPGGSASRGGGAEGNRLARFAAGKSLSSFISDEAKAVLMNPLEFELPNKGGRAYGYEATVLADICEGVLAARKAGALMHHQQGIAVRCEILVRGFARTGIIALVDEATGFQSDRNRDALAKILTAFIAKELQPYAPTFRADFYQNLLRLRKMTFNGSLQHPRYIGKLTNDLVYRRLAPGVLEELRRINPPNERGQRKHKHFQWLTQQIGYQKLLQHLAAVTALMRVFDDYDDFKKAIDKALPVQLPMPLFDKKDAPADEPAKSAQ
jgi:hypothetical protein